MTHRERFLATLHNGTPDRIPIVANLTIQAAEKIAAALGTEVGFVDSFLATRISHREILLKMGNDAVLVAATPATPSVVLENGDVRDELGITYRNCRPLRRGRRAAVERVRKPGRSGALSPARPARAAKWAFSQDVIARYKADYGVIGDLEACLFELSWNLVGLEKFLVDLMTEESTSPALLDRVEEYSTQCGLKMIQLGVDMIWAGDDFGTQNAMILSPQLWREHFKPRYERMWKAFRRANPDIKIAYHSCGSIVPIIEDYIEIGLDFLNPIQPLAAGMDLAQLYKRYGDRLGFFGGVDVQNVLPNGTQEDVRKEVRRVMDAVEHSPRFIIAPAHNIQPDTSVENILAFFDEAIKYGKIPAPQGEKG